MDQHQQTQDFIEELDRVINRFRSEYDIMLATAVGVLNILAFDLMKEASEPDTY